MLNFATLIRWQMVIDYFNIFINKFDPNLLEFVYNLSSNTVIIG